MPKVQVSREQVLEAAIQLIIREGHEQMNIKTVAQELGRSTQTISWTFGNMEKFREELTLYAREYVNRKLIPVGNNPIMEFAAVGEGYISLAYDAPNLLRFIHSNSGKVVEHGGIGSIFDEEKNEFMKKAIMDYTGMNEENTVRFMKSVVIYARGLVVFLLDGTIACKKEEAFRMLKETGIVYMVYGGVSKEEVVKYFETDGKRI